MQNRNPGRGCFCGTKHPLESANIFPKVDEACVIVFESSFIYFSIYERKLL